MWLVERPQKSLQENKRSIAWWIYDAGPIKGPAFMQCAEHARQLEGESPFDNLMEVKS